MKEKNLGKFLNADITNREKLLIGEIDNSAFEMQEMLLHSKAIRTIRGLISKKGKFRNSEYNEAMSIYFNQLVNSYSPDLHDVILNYINLAGLYDILSEKYYLEYFNHLEEINKLLKDSESLAMDPSDENLIRLYGPSTLELRDSIFQNTGQKETFLESLKENETFYLKSMKFRYSLEVYYTRLFLLDLKERNFEGLTENLSQDDKKQTSLKQEKRAKFWALAYCYEKQIAGLSLIGIGRTKLEEEGIDYCSHLRPNTFAKAVESILNEKIDIYNCNVLEDKFGVEWRKKILKIVKDQILVDKYLISKGL